MIGDWIGCLTNEIKDGLTGSLIGLNLWRDHSKINISFSVFSIFLTDSLNVKLLLKKCGCFCWKIDASLRLKLWRENKSFEPDYLNRRFRKSCQSIVVEFSFKTSPFGLEWGEDWRFLKYAVQIFIKKCSENSFPEIESE